MSQKYGIPFGDLPSHCLDAVDAAERTRARTLIVRGPQAIAAIVPMSDFDRIDPPDPGAAGQDPLLALCGSCRHDDFVDTFVSDLSQTSLWSAGRAAPTIPSHGAGGAAAQAASAQAGSGQAGYGARAQAAPDSGPTTRPGHAVPRPGAKR